MFVLVQKFRLQLTPSDVAYNGLFDTPLPITVGLTFKLRSFEMSNSDNSASTYASITDTA